MVSNIIFVFCANRLMGCITHLANAKSIFLLFIEMQFNDPETGNGKHITITHVLLGEKPKFLINQHGSVKKTIKFFT